jgi:acetoin:2,6-dichlorophenolindophenol oxidoreductase subunit alpha
VSAEIKSRVAPEVLVSIFTVASRIKIYDETYRSALRSGKIGGMYYSPRGQEIIPAACAAVLEPSDYVLTIYRGIHDQIAKGVPLRELTAEYFGRATGTCKGKGGPMHVTDVAHGLILTTGVVGSGLPIAVGVGLSAQMRESGQVAVVNFGDGASNIGAFHESLNMASLWKLPVVFMCQNNQYAEYTAYDQGTSVDSVAKRGASYSMPAERVDGNDPEEMYIAAKTAVDRARNGGGPTLLEAITFRFHGHTMNDSGSYIPKQQMADAKARDPMPKLRSDLIESGILTEAEVLEIEENLRREIDDAFEFALNSPLPDPADSVTDVYAEGVAI